MRATRTFTVRPSLPERLAPVAELALNLRWSWHPTTQALFESLDPEPRTRGVPTDPVAAINRVDRARLEELAEDADFLARLDSAHADLQRYLTEERWFQRQDSSPLRLVAYFSPEFGIAEALPQYSGGLGVLAGDHVKAASSLGVPLIGVGLLYRQGYFRQELSEDGWQNEHYLDLDPHGMALSLVEGVRVELDLGGVPVVAQVWCAQVGRATLYLLDTDVEDNALDERRITDRLYGGNVEHRLRQEIVLGVGGVRALHALGVTPQVFHTNEGHAGFLGLERIRQTITGNGLTFAEAVEAVRAGTVFTTHTPVPAGIDLFPRDLMSKYFKGWAEDFDVDFDEIMALGHAPGEAPEAPFNMAVMGLRLAMRSNAVSKLHGSVSRRMFGDLWPGVPEAEVPIGSITNGVHGSTWASPAMAGLFERHLGPQWADASAAAWEAIDGASDEELWALRNDGRNRLVSLVRERLRFGALGRGASEADIVWFDDVLDPAVLTIGFARRFAAYKRATLLLTQPERLEALLGSADRSVQFVFAGKAHPADEQGKQMIRQLIQFSRRSQLRHRVVFVEDYDIAVARVLLGGCDVWLNTPRRPFEACGTSGMKAALNGALNLSIRDGWWDELFDGENGWAIASAESYGDLEYRDKVEAANLFDVLERRVIPLFYERDDSGLPRAWLARMRASLRSLGPEVVAARMARTYVSDLYEPAAANTDAVAADGYAAARRLADWKGRVRAAWSAVEVHPIGAQDPVSGLGTERRVGALVVLGGLEPEDVEVQLVHGPVGQNDELTAPEVVPMRLVSSYGEADRYRFEATFTCQRAGRYGFTVRVVPSHPDLVTWTELGCVTWS